MLTQDRYVERLLDLYRRLPGTCGHILRDDRRTARDLRRRSIRLELVEQAFLLALARRAATPPHRPLPPIRTLRYFLPVLDEILLTPPDPDYLAYLRAWLDRHGLHLPDATLRQAPGAHTRPGARDPSRLPRRPSQSEKPASDPRGLP